MSVLVNGKFFDWGDITISLLPFSPIIFTATAINYNEEMATEAIYGRGNTPIGYGKGNWKASGSITLQKSEFETLALVAPNGILNLDPRMVAVNILYDNSLEGVATPTTETLLGVRFTKITDSASQNNKSLSTTLDFVILKDILRNGKSARGIKFDG